MTTTTKAPAKSILLYLIDPKKGNVITVIRPDLKNWKPDLTEKTKNYLKSLEKDYWKDNLLLPEKEAFKIIDAADDKTYNVGKWKQCTEAHFFDMLECLPPCNWQRLDNKEIFYVSEAETADIHQHLKRVWKKYYSWSFRRYGYKNIIDLI